MNIAELKLELIKKIIGTNDIEILMEINKILNDDSDGKYVVDEPSAVYEKEEKVRVFNEWQQKRIDIALKQVENGECISDEEAQKEIQAWLED